MEKLSGQSQNQPSRKVIGVLLAIALLTTILVPILIVHFYGSGSDTKLTFNDAIVSNKSK